MVIHVIEIVQNKLCLVYKCNYDAVTTFEIYKSVFHGQTYFQ